jgi:mono/diheme cytochrome c family protein
MQRSRVKLERIALLAGVLGLGSVVGLAGSAQTSGPRTLRDGVFSAAQVERGREHFETICMNCHEIAEFTGVGAYLEEVDGKPLWETFEYVWAEMPEDEPASLDPQDYAAILAYIFSVYGLPSGSNDLPIDRQSLEAITITRPSLPGS